MVHKIGEDDPDDVEDTEVDYFFLDGCCKCVNTWYNEGMDGVSANQ